MDVSGERMTLLEASDKWHAGSILYLESVPKAGVIFLIRRELPQHKEKEINNIILKIHQWV